MTPGIPPFAVPTAAPVAKRGIPRGKKLRLRENDLKDIFMERGERLSEGYDDIILGPFEARNNKEVELLRKEIGLDADIIEGGRAVERASNWLRRQQRQDTILQDQKEKRKRQTAEEQQCFVGNDQLSCYPTSGLRVNQGTWSRLIWNTNYPEFTNNGGFVDVYLFQQDTDQVATSWTSLPNSQGRLSFNPGDSWWQGRNRADNFNGTNISWPFYFVVTYAEKGLSGSTNRLSTWYAVQTALPVAVSLSRLSASASASSASLASAASAASQSAATLTGSAAIALSSSEAAVSSSFAASLSSALVSSLTAQGFTGTETLQGTATMTLLDGHQITATATAQANGLLPPLNDQDHSLPRYAIALISIFGFLALVGAMVGLYFLLAAARKRKSRMFGSDDLSNNGSSRPMMTADDGQPYSDEPASPVATVDTGMRRGVAATIREKEEGESGEEQVSPFSANEASRMADRFRSMLRDPTFASATTEDDAEEKKRLTMMSQESGNQLNAANELMREELKAQGHDLRQVETRRKPEVHE